MCKRHRGVEREVINTHEGERNGRVDFQFWSNVFASHDFSALVLSLLSTVANAQSSIWLEAECAQVGSLWNRTTDTSASNSQYVTIQPGNNSTASAPTNTAGHINFPFTVSQAGTYRLFAARAGAQRQRRFVLGAHGRRHLGDVEQLVEHHWVWPQFPNTFNLGAGSHTLTIAYREDGARLDKINITTSTAAPTGTGSPATNCSGGTTLVGLAGGGECGRGGQQHRHASPSLPTPVGP